MLTGNQVNLQLYLFAQISSESLYPHLLKFSLRAIGQVHKELEDLPLRVHVFCPFQSIKQFVANAPFDCRKGCLD